MTLLPSRNFNMYNFIFSKFNCIVFMQSHASSWEFYIFRWGNIEFLFSFGRVMSLTKSFIHSLDEKLHMSMLQSRLDFEFLLAHMCSVKFKEWIVVLATLLRLSEEDFWVFGLADEEFSSFTIISIATLHGMLEKGLIMSRVVMHKICRRFPGH